MRVGCSIRGPQEQDIARLIGLAGRLLREVYGDTVAFDEYGAALFFARCIVQPAGLHCAVAVCDDIPVGFAAAEVVSPVFFRDQCVRDVAVYLLPEFRGTFTGSKLLRSITKFADSAGLRSEVYLRGHAGASSVSGRFGFNVAGQIFERGAVR